jgi:hypothetical protein
MLPASGTNRKQGLLWQSVKTCIWLGSPDCYRNQDAVLWEPSERHAARKWSDRALKRRLSGHTVRDGRTASASSERGGTTPFNLLPIPSTTAAAGQVNQAIYAKPYFLDMDDDQTCAFITTRRLSHDNVWRNPTHKSNHPARP